MACRNDGSYVSTARGVLEVADTAGTLAKPSNPEGRARVMHSERGALLCMLEGGGGGGHTLQRFRAAFFGVVVENFHARGTCIAETRIAQHLGDSSPDSSFGWHMLAGWRCLLEGCKNFGHLNGSLSWT